MARVYVSIGSNIDPQTNVVSSVDALHHHFGELIRSTIYECPTVGFEGPNFYNLVVGFDTDEDVYMVRQALRDIEKAHHRKRCAQRYYDRTLDLDLLIYDDMVSNDETLRLPRDEILRYAFVLRPLVEIAGDEVHPVTGLSYADHWKRFDASSQPMWPLKESGDGTVNLPVSDHHRP